MDFVTKINTIECYEMYVCTLFTTMILVLTVTLLICDGRIYLKNAVEHLINYKANII